MTSFEKGYKRIGQNKTIEANHEIQATFSEKFKELESDLRLTVEHFFRGLSGKFKVPSYERYERKFSDYMESSSFSSKKEHYSFLANIAIRLVDDFLDQIYWPDLRNRLKKQNVRKSEEIKNMTEFLSACYNLASSYDPNLPKNIVDLPLIELRLEMDPKQDVFDSYILDYFDNKTKDIEYMNSVYNPAYRRDSDEDINSLERIKVTMSDLEQDWNERESGALDFELGSYIRENSLNPKILVEHVSSYRNMAHDVDGYYGTSYVNLLNKFINELNMLNSTP